MSLKTLSAFCSLAALITSCGQHVYMPALYHQDIAYQPKPSSFDSVKTAIYISGAYSIYANSNLDDQLESGQVNVGRGYIYKHFNLAYGAFGSFGDYENLAINRGKPDYFHDKFFGAIGGRVSGNIYATDDGNDYRYLGFEAAYSHEFGAFASLRQYFNSQPGYYVDPRTDLFTIGLTTEILIQSSKHKKLQQGFRFFEGTTLGYNNLTSVYYNNKKIPKDVLSQLIGTGIHKFFPRATYFLKISNCFGTAEYYGDGLSLRFGYTF
jgi:hypothetical protein